MLFGGIAERYNQGRYGWIKQVVGFLEHETLASISG
jgi:hypothetical protein